MNKNPKSVTEKVGLSFPSGRVFLAAALLFSLLLVTILPLPLLQQFFPAAYADSYYAALQDKYKALAAMDGEDGKILVIGGSATAFALDSDLLTEETGRPCMNFGLYAAFGTQYMMELAKDHIQKGDLVILCPELSSQTCSMYFGAEAVLQGSEGNLALLLKARLRDYPALLAAYPSYFTKKLEFLGGETASSQGVYARSSFDEKGNMTFLREENVMEYGYLPDALPEITPDIYEEEFLTYLNDYAETAIRKGAQVYYAFPFLCDLSVQDVREDEMEEFEDFLAENLDFPLLSDLSSRILDAAYFYDSNYHPNTPGMQTATLRLALDVKRVLGDMTELKHEEPEAPETQFEREDGEVFTDGIYLYRENSKGVTLAGITKEGKQETRLEIPSEIGGYTLTGIGKEAFRGCVAEEIILPETVESLGGSLFADCTALKILRIRSRSMPSVGDTLLQGLDGEIRILVKADLYGDYATDYFWLYYSNYLEAEE